MVVVERYTLSFWRHGHEERVQCETAHYRDAKTTSCLPKISFKFNGTSLLNKFRHCKNGKNHFLSFRKHKRNYVTNDDIDMKFGTDVSNSRTNIKIKEFARIG